MSEHPVVAQSDAVQLLLLVSLLLLLLLLSLLLPRHLPMFSTYLWVSILW
jgi:hypothetical protein